MPLSDRDYMREEHPPACTCVSCTKTQVKQEQAVMQVDSTGRSGEGL